MAEELPLAPSGSPLATETLPASQPQPTHQSNGGDARLVAILQKQAGGEKLSASDRGYLGVIKRRGTPKTMATPPNPNPLLTAPANPENPLFEAAGAPPVAAEAKPSATVNSDLLHRAADSILSSLDKATQIYVGFEARQIGANDDTVARWKKAVELQPQNRELVVENSDPIVLAACEWFGCTPENLDKYVKKSGFFGGLFAHGLGVYAVVKELRAARLERQQSEPEKK